MKKKLTIFALLLIIFASNRSLAQTLSLTSSNSYQPAINLTYSNQSQTGNQLTADIQITNTSGTWVYLEEDLTSSPLGIPYTDYLLGPNGTETFHNVTFLSGNYLQFNVTTPIGLDYTDLDPKCRALFGALTVDYLMRGLLTTPLPANAFDNMTGAIDPLLDNVVSSLGTVGDLATAVKDRNYGEMSSALAQLALNSDQTKDAVEQLLQNVAPSQVDNFFDAASGTLDTLKDILDVYGKIQMLTDLTKATFNAPLLTVNRLDLVATVQTPIITSVFPTSLPTSSLPQTIKIVGSGFTSSSTLILTHGTSIFNSVAARLTNSSPNELDYGIIVDNGTGTWSVIVTNAGQVASNPQTFTVNTPPPNTGSLVVNLSPSGIGAQWQANGTYYDSGEVVSLALGQYTVSFKPVSGYTTPANQTVTVNASAQTTTNATYTAVAPTTYTLTLNANSAQGSVSVSPTASGGIYNSGSVVQLTASANSGYNFTDWSGDLTGSISPTNITMNSSKTITANFASGDLGLATINVTLLPQAAITAGAQWKFNGFGWTNSGVSYTTTSLGANQNYLQFQNVSGYITPSPFYVTVGGGQTTNITVTYQQDTTPGLLTVTLSPPDAINAGAHWHVNGGTYGNGTPVSLAPGNYTVTFDSVSGWTAPASQSVTIQPSETVVLSGNYTPPADQPAIGGISPPIGAMTGGTLMTISGANFTAPATVLIGGQAASNVSVSGSTQITCMTPAGTNYGSASVVVQTASGNATNLNGFA